jgi:hypothetical protein
VLYRLSYASEVGEGWARGELAWKDSRHRTEIGEKGHRTNEPNLASLFALNEREKALPPTPHRSALFVRGGDPRGREWVTPAPGTVKHIPYPTRLIVYSGPRMARASGLSLGGRTLLMSKIFQGFF